MSFWICCHVFESIVNMLYRLLSYVCDGYINSLVYDCVYESDCRI